MKRDRKGKEYRRLLANLKALARSEERDWDESAWQRALAGATAEEPAARRPAWRSRPSWAWAYGAAVVIILGAGAVVTRNLLHRPSAAAVEEAGPAPEGGAAQKQLSVTLVSGESGLRVYWYFDKEFDWKEEK
jgi:hypothetical protein